MGLPSARQRLQRVMMGDTCTITYAAATPVDDAIDPLTLKPVPSLGETPTTIYSGPCAVSTRSATGADTQADPGGAPADLGDYEVVLPYDAPSSAAGAVVTINSASDGAMVGLVLVVVSCTFSSLDLARVIQAQLLAAGRPLHGR